MLPKVNVQPHRVVHFLPISNYQRFSVDIALRSPELNRHQDQQEQGMESPVANLESNFTPVQPTLSRNRLKNPSSEDENHLLRAIEDFMQRTRDDRTEKEHNIARLEETIEDLNGLVQSKEEEIKQLKMELKNIKTSIRIREERQKELVDALKSTID